jgi:hypothetical protein
LIAFYNLYLDIRGSRPAPRTGTGVR